MADATVSRLGQAQQAGDVNALFLKVYAGEVLTAFRRANKTGGKFMERTITSGKSAQFPATWKNAAAYHTPGAELVGKLINHAEVVVTIDDLLVSDVFIAAIDEAKNHFDVRREYSFQSGQALAVTRDKNVLRVAGLASRGTAIHTGLSPGAALVTNAAMKTDASVLASGIFTAAQTLDERDVPEEDDRFTWVRPAQYYLLVSNKDLLNKDWGGRGSFASAEVPEVAGTMVMKTNNLPITDESADTSIAAQYRANWANTAALVTHRHAAATVSLMDLKLEMAYDIRRQGTLIVAKYAIGHGAIRPESAVELATA